MVKGCQARTQIERFVHYISPVQQYHVMKKKAYLFLFNYMNKLIYKRVAAGAAELELEPSSPPPHWSLQVL